LPLSLVLKSGVVSAQAPGVIWCPRWATLYCTSCHTYRGLRKLKAGFQPKLHRKE
jgi:hypothetical protein